MRGLAFVSVWAAYMASIAGIPFMCAGCHHQPSERNWPEDRALLAESSSAFAFEAFAQFDAKGHRCYRMTFACPNIRVPLPRKNTFASIADLAEAIRANTLAVYEGGFWEDCEEEVEPLTKDEVAQISSLLGEEAAHDDGTIKEGGFGMEVFAQVDYKGRRLYRLLHMTSGIKAPVPPLDTFTSIEDLTEAIRGVKTEVYATDFVDPSCPWIVGEEKAENLTIEEIEQIKSLLAHQQDHE